MPVYSQEDIVSMAGSAFKDRERPAAVFFENIVKRQCGKLTRVKVKRDRTLLMSKKIARPPAGRLRDGILGLLALLPFQ